GLAAVPAQHAAVAGLTAAGGIEDRAVQPHAAFLHGGDRGVGVLEIGVLPEEFFDHGRGFRALAGRAQGLISDGVRPAALRQFVFVGWHYLKWYAHLQSRSVA